jgi:hypothetical protein
MIYKYIVTKNESNVFLEKYWPVISALVPWILTLVTVWISFSALNDETKWKKTAFLSQEYQRFVTDKSVILFRSMLYNDSRNLEIIPGKVSFIRRDYISAALDTANISEILVNVPDSGYKINLDIRVREMADNYFQYLAVFQRYIAAGVFTYEDVKPYFRSDLRQLCDASVTDGDDDSLTELQISLKGFLSQDKYADARAFIARFQ